MKFYFSKNLYSRLSVLIVVALTVFIIHSCKKDRSANQAAAIANSSMINMAKQWYGATYPAKSNTKLTQHSTGASQQDWTQVFSPYWDKANTFVMDSLTFIELPALKKGDMAMSMKPHVDPKNFNFAKSGSLTSLIIANKKGSFYIYAMTILADSSYVKGDYSKLTHNTYRHRDKDFTGYVFYNRMNGEFVNGWRYTNGSVTGIINQTATSGGTGTQAVQSASKQVNVAEQVDCQTTITTTYWESCNYYENNPENLFNCYYYTTDQTGTVCTVAPSNGGASSATTPQNPCKTPPDTTQDITSVKKIIDVADPNPPGGTGSGSGSNTGGIVDQTNQIGTSQCQTQTVTPDTVKMTFCSGLNAAEQSSITTSLNTFKNEDCASKFLYAYFANKTFNFCISPGNYNVIFNPQTNTFTYSTDDATAPAFAYLLEHEFFHAFQNADYTGGISQYGKNASTGVASPGFVNIEFEQAVFNDIVNNTHSAFNNGSLNQQSQYQDWLNQLTNNGTVYPKLTPSSSAYTQFIDKYNSFLQQYDALPNNPNSSQIINLTPQAFIDLFNVVNPNC